MVHLPALIQDLGIILITAAIVSLLFKRLKQPVVLGYLMAGILVGPYFSLMPTVNDTTSLSVWAEIGVIFLLFALGLEFSFKKLTQVGVSASITGLFEILFMIFIGFLSGRYLGWTNMDSLFLGGIISIASTTIIVRTFGELGLRGKKFVSLVFGVLIVEDLMAVLLMVLLSTVAVTRAFSGIELLFSTVKLMFFLIVWFALGIYTLPLILKKFRSSLNDETMLIFSIGLCLLMVIIATETGFSAALGAFVMGSLLAETREGKTIEHLIGPVKNLFAAIFFVSVGMMLNPSILKEYFGVIIFLTAVVIIGKSFAVTLGAALSGQSLKTSMQTGMSLANIGEFSFIIATLGISLKVTNSRLYPIAVAVSALTTFTTPYMVKFSAPLFFWLEKHMPEEIKAKLLMYQTDISVGPKQSIISILWNMYGKKILLNGVVIFAMTLSVKKYVMPVMIARFGDEDWVQGALALTVLVFTSPFLWAVSISKGRIDTHELIVLKTMKVVDLVISILRLLLGVFLISFIVGEFISLQAASLFIFLGLAGVGVFLAKFSEPFYKRIEHRFLSHLDDREKHMLEEQRKMPLLAPWNATLAEYVLSPDSYLVGKTLAECGIKEKFGVMVALIERGSKKIIAPGRQELMMPYDRLFLIGTDEQLDVLKILLEVNPTPVDAEDGIEIFGLGSLVVTTDSEFQGKTIRECGLREKVHGLIVGLERRDQRLLNPDSSLVLMPGDLIWVVGDRLKIKSLA